MTVPVISRPCAKPAPECMPACAMPCAARYSASTPRLHTLYGCSQPDHLGWELNCRLTSEISDEIWGHLKKCPFALQPHLDSCSNIWAAHHPLPPPAPAHSPRHVSFERSIRPPYLRREVCTSGLRSMQAWHRPTPDEVGRTLRRAVIRTTKRSRATSGWELSGRCSHHPHSLTL